MTYYFNRYCKDYQNIENYEKAKADNFKGWECHHRLETHNSDGERRLVDITREELLALGMYYDRPSEELIFLKASAHTILHRKGKPAWNKGVPMSNEQKKKLSDANKGKHLSEATIKKMREALKGRQFSEETRKKLSEAAKGNTATKGLLWFNNGKTNVRAKECPEGFTPGRIPWKK